MVVKPMPLIARPVLCGGFSTKRTHIVAQPRQEGIKL